MQAYYSGADEFKCLTSEDGKTYGSSSTAVKVKNNFVDIIFNLDLAIYKKSTSQFSWYAAGFGIQGNDEVEIFPCSLKIAKVMFSKDSKIIGLSLVDNLLYESIFNENAQSFQYSKILFQEIPKLTDISCSEGSEILALDNNGGIYSIISNDNNDFHLKLLFQLDNLKIQKISTGFDHSMVLTDTGAIYSWGIGSRGQLGHSDIVLKCESPKRVEFFDDLPCTIVDIACGGWHSLALTSDGDIYSWGWNESGQLGHSTEKMSTVVGSPYPIDLGSGNNPVIGISAGSRHSAAILKNGDVYTCGWNKYGQLSVGNFENRSIPTKVKLKDSGNVTKISCTRWGTAFYAL